VLTVAWFLLRRLVAGILVVAGVSILIFLLVRILPGDPARLALGPSATQEQVVELQRQMGFDRPWLTQYAVFVSRATHLDFGISLYTDRPVSTDLAEAFPATLELALAAGLVMAVFGTVLGIASAYDKDGAIDSGSRLLAVVCVAMPNFVWAILLVLFLSYWLDWLPIGGQLSDGMTPVPVVSGLLVLDAVTDLARAARGSSVSYIGVYPLDIYGASSIKSWTYVLVNAMTSSSRRDIT
jgi:peptide/nickel transport system permease protein